MKCFLLGAVIHYTKKALHRSLRVESLDGSSKGMGDTLPDQIKGWRIRGSMRAALSSSKGCTVGGFSNDKHSNMAPCSIIPLPITFVEWENSGYALAPYFLQIFGA